MVEKPAAYFFVCFLKKIPPIPLPRKGGAIRMGLLECSEPKTHLSSGQPAAHDRRHGRGDAVEGVVAEVGAALFGGDAGAIHFIGVCIPRIHDPIIRAVD